MSLGTIVGCVCGVALIDMVVDKNDLAPVYAALFSAGALVASSKHLMIAQTSTLGTFLALDALTKNMCLLLNARVWGCAFVLGTSLLHWIK